MNETTYIINRTKLTSAFKSYMKAKKALINNGIDRKDFDIILGNYSAVNKMYRTAEYSEYQIERRQ
jgi:BioD-like phosphotransacetylase family protein